MDYFRAKRYLDTLPDWETGRPPTGPLEHYLPRMRALLARLGNPQQDFRSVIVGGTNGKGTVASLLANLIQAEHMSVGLYTSPHLHTQRERICVDAQVLSKDEWADAVERLYDCSRDFEREALGAFSKFEALTALAAHFFAEKNVAWGIFEVGLGGRYDATNAWDSAAAVLTRVGLDHVGVLGNTLEEIVADKAHIARSGHMLFTTPAQEPQVLEQLHRICGERDVDLQVAAAEALDEAACSGRAAHYAQNAQLALAAARGIGLTLETSVAHRVITEHWWPGRFERACEHPLVVIDGAHNPQAAQGLAADLARLAARWTLVVGAGEGHDASGLLAALAPVAEVVVLTASDHAKAQAVTALACSAPAQMRTEVVPSFAEAMRRGQQLAGKDGALCVTGSLYLVARAREFFDLPCERDSITEDVALESLACVQQACSEMELSYMASSENETLLRIDGRGRPFYFWRNKHPFNDYTSAHIAEDKAFQYEIFTCAALPVPFTLQVFNPLADPRFDRYKTHATIAEIVEEATEKFHYPIVVKKYRSSLSQGVFLQHNALGLQRRLQHVFENSAYLDNIVLLQEHVPGPEYRAVATQGELLLAYGKESALQGGEDLNPLHQSNGRAVRLEEGALLEAIGDLVRQVAEVVELGFYAIDLIEGKEGLRILELNPNPFCFFYNKDNGRSDFVAIYRKLLEKYAL